MTSWPAEAAATNLASVVESATIGCRQDIQDMAPEPIFKTKALVELLGMCVMGS
jgi:hypothetical protein